MWASVENLRDSYNPRAPEAIAAASHILWSLSGRKFSGTHNVTELYDVRHGMGWVDRYAFLQQQALFQIENRDAVICTKCGFPHRMRLRHQPVQRVLSVEINGEIVPSTDYALLNHSTLGFPFSQIACTAMCAKVTYIWGVNPPAGGRAAAAALADQFLLAWDGDDDCKLPQRVTNVTRQGVSWTILDPQDFLDEGKTGIYTIDLFLRAVNPDKARRPARVFSPDIPRAQTITQELTPPSTEITLFDLGVMSPGQPAWYVAAPNLWPSTAYTVHARVNGIEYGPDHFTHTPEGSYTLMLSGSETMPLVDGDPFQIFYRLTGGGGDTVVIDGLVRFVQA